METLIAIPEASGIYIITHSDTTDSYERAHIADLKREQVLSIVKLLVDAIEFKFQSK